VRGSAADTRPSSVLLRQALFCSLCKGEKYQDKNKHKEEHPNNKSKWSHFHRNLVTAARRPRYA
jgi:hypothetical protein